MHKCRALGFDKTAESKKENIKMQIISSKAGVLTIECCQIFRHFIGWGNGVICPYCGETKAMDTLQQEAERRREGENLVMALI